MLVSQHNAWMYAAATAAAVLGGLVLKISLTQWCLIGDRRPTAGAVPIAAVGAVVIGALVFLAR